jgi:lysyl-tRNA synthetase, class II
MATIDKIKEARLKKIRKIKNLGFSCYPGETKRSHTNQEALENFNSLSKSKKEITLVGRIKSQRGHGKACFIDIEDGTALIQVFLRQDGLGEKQYLFFLENFDIGDFIEIKGSLFSTKRKEKTIDASGLKMLSKSVLPLPEKWHGLKDVEERFRKRYLDLIFNEKTKENFKKRSRIVMEIRNFLINEGFLEVETPILQPIYGGAGARPFKTKLNALKMDFYLRIAPELYLKRLLVGGFEKVFEIGRNFRNEGMDRSHNPDFTAMEFYWAYANYKDLMKLTEKMFTQILKNVFNKTEIEYEGKKVNFKAPWPRYEFSDLIKTHAGIDIDSLTEKALESFCKKNKIKLEKGMDKAKISDEIFKKFCRPKIWQPSFILHYPLGFQPLAKALDKNPEKLANIQLVVAGWEIVNAFSELNDPAEQKRRFLEQEQLFHKGLEEAQRVDEDYLEAMSYGMPPAAGFGLGIDRLVTLLTDSHSLREVILFPAMKKRK